ncbi:unnamed protein product [Didymodactylos carnosus]|uniref:Uncharacterized protein n=1 Tax=Didymodactylos carnosus TaxID=1234261 RepID=A0A814DRD1_9BILA|nr:unnamed protein product [Didymodactylos carnosus]CAF3732362.1 unnamed protein product [Didymodactylos carnosus]
MTYQSIKYRNQIENIRIQYVNDIPYLFLQDVRSYFPPVTTLRLNNSQIPFAVDDNSGDLLLPLRVRAYPTDLLTGYDFTHTTCTNIDEIDDEDDDDDDDDNVSDTDTIRDELEIYLTQLYDIAKVTIDKLTGIEQVKYQTLIGCFVFCKCQTTEIV